MNSGSLGIEWNKAKMSDGKVTKELNGVTTPVCFLYTKIYHYVMDLCKIKEALKHTYMWILPTYVL